MFTETMATIQAEIEWINYELTRQSTNSEQESRLKTKREMLKKISTLCERYDNGDLLTDDTGASKTHMDINQSL